MKTSDNMMPRLSDTEADQTSRSVGTQCKTMSPLHGLLWLDVYAVEEVKFLFEISMLRKATKYTMAKTSIKKGCGSKLGVECPAGLTGAPEQNQHSSTKTHGTRTGTLFSKLFLA